MGLSLEPGLKSFGETDPNHELTHKISHPEYIVQIIRIVEKTSLDHITALLVGRVGVGLPQPSHDTCTPSHRTANVQGFLHVVGQPLHDSPQKRLISNF